MGQGCFIHMVKVCHRLADSLLLIPFTSRAYSLPSLHAHKLGIFLSEFNLSKGHALTTMFKPSYPQRVHLQMPSHWELGGSTFEWNSNNFKLLI